MEMEFSWNLQKKEGLVEPGSDTGFGDKKQDQRDKLKPIVT